MKTGLDGRWYLVTGASGGIGGAVARTLAAEGAHVCVHYHRNEDGARSLAEELSRRDGVRTLIVQADLSDEAAVDAMYEAIFDHIGDSEGDDSESDDSKRRASRLDGIVANAGKWSPSAPVRTMTMDQWRLHVDTNLTATFLTCRGFLRHLADAPRDDASIVMIGSTAAVFGEADHADYAAAKAGLTYGLTKSLKNEIVRLAARGRVNCVCPGWTETPMAAAAMRDPEGVARSTRTMALRKVATPEDIANAVVYLSSPTLAGHVSGEVLTVAGGMEGRQLHD